MAYVVRSTKSNDDFTGSPVRKTRSVSVNDVSPSTNIIERSSDIPDRYRPSSLTLFYERCYIDLTGPHPRSKQGHTYILTCVDAFTKWAEAFPLRSKEAEPVVLFCRF